MDQKMRMRGGASLDVVARAVTLMRNENGLARFCLFEAISVDGRRDIDLCHPEHADGDCFPSGNEMDH